MAHEEFGPESNQLVNLVGETYGFGMLPPRHRDHTEASTAGSVCQTGWQEARNSHRRRAATSANDSQMVLNPHNHYNPPALDDVQIVSIPYHHVFFVFFF